MMGFIFILLVTGTVVFLFRLIDLGLSAFSAIDGHDNDPNEDYEDALLARSGGNTFAEVDTRSPRFYNEFTRKSRFPRQIPLKTEQ
jgi:hypothetical protein